MKRTYYFAAWTDSDCLLGCDHQHKTVTSAAACISSVGGYVVAVTKGRLRELTILRKRNSSGQCMAPTS